MKRVLSLLVCMAATVGVHAFAADTPQLQTRDARYHLHSGDVLGITYRYSPEYDATASIQPDGYADFPMLGELKLSGLTVDQARERILEKANTRLNDPEISVILKEFEKPYYIVGGEVGHPGKFDLRGDTSVAQAVAIAGGLSASAKHSQILVFHRVPDGWMQVKKVNLKKMFKEANLEEDAQLQAGDFLFVPKNTFSKIERFIPTSSVGMYTNPILH